MKFRPPFRCRRGFSLMELLIVTAILPAVAFVIFANFSSAMRLWQRLEKPDPSEDVAIFCLKAQRDMAQGFRYEGQPFTGDVTRFSIMTLAETAPALGGDLAVGRVDYRLDPYRKVLVREMRNMSDLAREKTGHVTQALNGVTGVRMSYLVLDQHTKKFLWTDAVSEKDDTLPAAVRVEFAIEQDGERRELRRTFAVPAGAAVPT